MKVAAKAMIAYNSGKTARIIVLPNTSFPEPIAAIPLAVTLPCFIAEKSPTKPKATPAAKKEEAPAAKAAVAKKPATKAAPKAAAEKKPAAKAAPAKKPAAKTTAAKTTAAKKPAAKKPAAKAAPKKESGDKAK